MKKLTVNSLAAGNLKMRKKQYFSLILGIILSMVFSSGAMFFVACYRSSDKELRARAFGKEDLIFFDTDTETMEKAVGNGLITSYSEGFVTGWAYTEEYENGCAVAYLDKNSRELYYPYIEEGSYPERPGEIAVERSALLIMGLRNVSVGDSISFKFAVRDGSGTLAAENEKTYVLTGIVSDKRSSFAGGFSMKAEPFYYFFPAAYICEEEGSEPGGKASVIGFAEEKKGEYHFETAEKTGISGDMVWQVYGGFFGNQSPLSDLMEKTVFSTVFACALMIVSSIGIVNAFNNVLLDRKKQIGLFRALGATRRQIITVYGREALLISLFCVPVSAALSFFGVKLICGLLSDDFIFISSFISLAAGLAVSVAVVMAAAMLPLLKASRVSPMQAVRNTEINRKMYRKKVKTQTSFTVSNLLAKRNRKLFGARQFIAAFLIAATVFASSFCFGILNEFDSVWVESADYVLSFSGERIYFTRVNYPSPDSRYPESAVDMLLGCPCVSTVTGETSFRTVIPFDGKDLYTAMLDSDHQFVRGISPEADDEKLIEDILDNDAAMEYLRKQELILSDAIALKMTAWDTDKIERLSSAVVEGKINASKIANGEEVVLIAPEELGVYLADEGNPPYGYVAPTNGAHRENRLLASAKCSLHRGDELEINVFSADELPADNGIPEGKVEKTVRKVKIGAVCSLDEMDRLGFYLDDRYGLLTSIDAAGLFYPGYQYEKLYVTSDTEIGEKENAAIMEAVNCVTAGVSMPYVRSLYETAQRDRATKNGFLTALLSVILMLMTVEGSLICNSFSSRIRNGKRDIGTLRAVGADAKELTSVYVRELIAVFGMGFGAGFGIRLVVHFAVLAINKLSETPVFTYVELKLAVPVLFIAVLFGVCALSLYFNIRRLMKDSIVDNIREL